MLKTSEGIDKLIRVEYPKSSLSQLSCLFSSSQILKFSKESLLNIKGFNSNNSLHEIYEHLYYTLQQEYRCEYVYKNEIIKQLLLKNHNPKAKLYTEVEIHDSKADVLIVNGTSTVYEIKTELDTFDRLAKQLKAYKLVFDKVYVVTHYSKLQALLQSVECDVGVMVLNEKGRIKKIREALSNKNNVKPQFVFNLLRRDEYTKIIHDYYGFVPDAPPVTIFKVCKKLFVKLSPDLAHDYMVKALRNRHTPAFRENLLNSLPDSLKLIAISGKLTKRDCDNILQKLNTPFLS